MTHHDQTLTFSELVALDEPTLDRHRRDLATQAGDADATIATTAGTRATILDEDTGQPMWAAQAAALLGPADPATFPTGEGRAT